MSGAAAFNVAAFARVLRGLGFGVGPGHVMTALDALAVIDISKQRDVYWALHAVFVDRHTRSALFRAAFESFWRGHAPATQEQPETLPPLDTTEEPPLMAPAKRDALMSSSSDDGDDKPVAGQWSAAEKLRPIDFETMTAEEQAEARRLMSRLHLPIPAVPTRRFKPSHAGAKVDMHATMKKMVRRGGVIDLQKKRRAIRHPPLVILCDISGSMATYARMLLHFIHVITSDRDRVHTFLFGTRLTNVSREMAHRDPDVAFARVARIVQDWSGGTRIGQTLGEFNRLWSRRVLAQGAVVLLITDGLDRDGGAGLAAEMERLQHSCRRLIWLNPLLRYDAFEPKSAGIRAMLPYVDDFRPVHNLDSLASLVAALVAPPARTPRAA